MAALNISLPPSCRLRTVTSEKCACSEAAHGPAGRSPAELGFFDVTVSFAISHQSVPRWGQNGEQVTSMDSHILAAICMFCGANDLRMAGRAHGKGHAQDKHQGNQLNVSLCREIFESFDWVRLMSLPFTLVSYILCLIDSISSEICWYGSTQDDSQVSRGPVITCLTKDFHFGRVIIAIIVLLCNM